MKGLFIKDLALMKMRGKVLLFLIVWGFVMLAAMQDGSFVVGWIVMIAVITSMSTISYDEFDNGMQFLMSLPVTRRGYVLEKYVFSFACGVLFWLVSLVIVIIGGVVSGNAASLAKDIPPTVLTLAGMMIVPAVSIPPQLKWGAEKGRIVMLILFGVIFVGAFLIGRFGGLEAAADQLEALPIQGVIAGAVITCLVLTAVSILISMRIMEKKEF